MPAKPTNLPFDEHQYSVGKKGLGYFLCILILFPPSSIINSVLEKFDQLAIKNPSKKLPCLPCLCLWKSNRSLSYEWSLISTLYIAFHSSCLSSSIQLCSYLLLEGLVPLLWLSWSVILLHKLLTEINGTHHKTLFVNINRRSKSEYEEIIMAFCSKRTKIPLVQKYTKICPHQKYLGEFASLFLFP